MYLDVYHLLSQLTNEFTFVRRLQVIDIAHDTGSKFEVIIPKGATQTLQYTGKAINTSQ